MDFPPSNRRSWPQRGLRILLAVLVALATAYVMISPRTAEWFVFLPDGSDPGSPPPLHGVEGVDVDLETATGLPIHGWWWNAGPEAPAVLFFHGNAGNIASRVGTAEGLVARGVSVFLLEYRGYGRSQGRPSERGIVEDGRAGLEWVSREVGGTGRVVLHGRSLGGFVAAEVGSRTGVAGIILESAFTDLQDMAAAAYPFIPRFLLHRLRGHFDNLAAVSRGDTPVLVVHGTADRLVPVRMGEALLERAGDRGQWHGVDGAGHNDLVLVGGREYFDRIAAFVHEVTAVKGGTEH
jgi:uncharacterized protein